ncbi:NAD-dependent succinate-semialdehyde dehydrogenase [Leeia sp. TBRC 13508]|uniref:NAD-dependent succinate-semialdehyde dehydrogenase n=1 Tax=Leeia speluncae TaxID=2884804 RepID=A0ABS8D9R7_9NEIS|nr:NAD-dependent succinate-semialdehyde dehydrogenase [Leeia speluncae]MCB6184945.1 NAD-dependent succinate-semialdehyde dehydrogenase [Leeia speluncae]
MQLKDASLLQQQLYIDGAWQAASDGEVFAVTNPANDQVLVTVASATKADTARAIEVAEAALPAWRDLTAKARSNLLRNWYNLILENIDDLATILSAEQGKPLAEAKGEILYGASYIEWFAEEAKRVYGDTIPGPAADKRLVVIKQPIGVVAAITPWNFPNAMITRKVGPALAAGCTVVVKPATETPLSALALAVLAEKAGIPKGVINIVPGKRSGDIGGELTANPIVKKLSFTGSTRIGKLLMAQCADTIKKLSLELGGNAPFIVFDDADLDAAVQGAMIAKFRNTGQTCVCANRILVQSGVYDAFAEKLAAAVAAMQVGPALEGAFQQGPLINQSSLNKVKEHVEDALGKGAKVATGGKAHARGGLFYEPTVLTGVTNDMVVAKDETFGPVAPLFKFDTEADAIRLANDTEFGLAAYFYSRDIGRAWRVAEKLECGMVGINEGLISNEAVPFGGIKESGLGREGSKYGIEEYLEIKYMCFGGI